MTEPVRVGELLPGVLQEVIARAGPGYDRWMEQVAQTGYCAHPVRLRGTIEQADPQTGEVRTIYSTDQEPDATLLKGCGNRRATVCPSCSATYQADQFQLLAAGLRGGKGVPETVAGHPRLFVTFTAPSFGSVHTRKAQGLLVFPCHPYRQGQRCPHGRRTGCWQRHDPDDPKLGEPLCGRCYQAAAQVLWNGLAGRLWSRTTIYLYRTLAQLAGVTEAELRGAVRISFAKVAEYQKRVRSTSTPSSDWTLGPIAAVRPAWRRGRPGSPGSCSRPPAARRPRLWPCLARRSLRTRGWLWLPAGATSSTCVTSPRPGTSMS
jgi:hypothetical protein